MNAIDTSPSNNGRSSEAWSGSCTHLRVGLPELEATVPLEERLERTSPPIAKRASAPSAECRSVARAAAWS
jgi:hypothetical protein